MEGEGGPEEKKSQVVTDQVAVVYACDTVVYTEATTEGFGDSVKRAFGYETNRFVINAQYREFSSRQQTEKHVEIKQADSFEKMMSQEFFVDLMKHGPLSIKEFSISCEHPDKEYYVHDDLIKTLDKLRNAFMMHNLSMSIILDLNVHLKFSSNKHAMKFANALNRVARMFNVKIHGDNVNLQTGEHELDLSESFATQDELGAVLFVFEENKRSLIVANLNTPPPQYGAAFVVGSDLHDFVEGRKAIVPVLLYKHYDREGKLPGHFENGYFEKNTDTTQSGYAARFYSVASTTYLTEKMVILVEQELYTKLEDTLRPRKQKSSMKTEASSRGRDDDGDDDRDDDEKSVKDERQTRDGMCQIL